MKAMNYLPAGLLLLLCVLNLYLGIITMPDSSFVMYLVFGLVYLTLGVILINKFRFAELLGFIMSLALVFIYPLLVDFKHLNPWLSGIMGATDAIVAICCLFLLMMKL